MFGGDVHHIWWDNKIILNVSDGCLFNGQLYIQNQQWHDGCGYTCVCQNATTGHFSCRERWAWCVQIYLMIMLIIFCLMCLVLREVHKRQKRKQKWEIIIIVNIFKAPTVWLKVLNKHTHTHKIVNARTLRFTRVQAVAYLWTFLDTICIFSIQIVFGFNMSWLNE